MKLTSASGVFAMSLLPALAILVLLLASSALALGDVRSTLPYPPASAELSSRDITKSCTDSGCADGTFRGTLREIGEVEPAQMILSSMPRGRVAQILFDLLRLIESGGKAPQGQTGVVTEVIDGDTIRVRVGATDKTVRLIGVDASETGETFAAEAEVALEKLALVKTVVLETDVAKADLYGRTLAYVWVLTGDTYLMANERMLQLGLATLYTVPPNVKYSQRLTAAEDQAQGQRVGTWVPGDVECPLEIIGVSADAPGNDNDNPNGEYVTFRVLASGTLLGYAVEDASGHHYDFPDRVFAKGQVFGLHTGSSTDSQTDLYWNVFGSAVWNNSGDTVRLLDAQGHILESYTY